MVHIVEVKGLTKSFGQGQHAIHALRRLDLTILRGRVVGLIGPNGAGKSTLIHCILGLVQPDSGQIRVFGDDVIRERSRVLERLGVVLDGNRFLFPPLTVWQNLFYVGLLHGVPLRDVRHRIAKAVERTQIEELLRQRCYRLSLGQKQRVLIAGALLTNPELLILDEPTTGLDDRGTQMMAEYIKAEASEGTTILVASHQLEWLESVADEFLLLSEGRVVWHGSLTDYQSAAETKQQWIVRGPIPDWTRKALDGLSAQVRPIDAEHSEVTLSGQAPQYLEVFHTLAAGGCTVTRFSNGGLSLREVYRQLMALEVQRTVDRVSRANQRGR